MGIKAKDICMILEALGKAGATSFKMGDIEVELGKSQITDRDVGEENSEEDFPIQSPNEMMLRTSEEKAIMEQTQHEQLMIDDPLSYETIMVDGLIDSDRVSNLTSKIGEDRW